MISLDYRPLGPHRFQGQPVIELLKELTHQLDPKALMDRVTERVCQTMLTNADGAAVSICQDGDRFFVISATGTLAPRLNAIVPTARTFQAVTLESLQPALVDDIMSDSRLMPDVRTIGADLGVRSCLAIPLVSGAVAVGVLTVVSRMKDAFATEDIARIMAASTLITSMICARQQQASLLQSLVLASNSGGDRLTARFLAGVSSPEMAERDETRAMIEDVIVSSKLNTVFQPIVDLNTGEVVAAEALSRFPAEPFGAPEAWFAAAYRVGLGIDLETHAVKNALGAADAGCWKGVLSINLSPPAAVDPYIQEILLGAAGRLLIVELTENVRSPELRTSDLETLRQSGILLAIDDTGSGYSGLSRILKLRPDIVKIDRTLTTQIDNDPARRALASALVSFSREIDAHIIAEGVENSTQHATLRDLGVRFGQGFLYGTPVDRPLFNTPNAPSVNIFR